jgi:cysteine desulfurase/selenocysteine lyase
VEVRSVPDRDGAIDVQAMIDHIDDRTRLVTAATVTFAPGFRTDVAALGRVCRENGIFFLVDGVQSVGVVATDVEAMLVDGLAVSTQKGLCGLYGMGFLYCRREWADRITPAALARFSVDLGADVHEATMGDGRYELMPGARRFDVGNYNFPAAVTAEPSLDLLLDVGPAKIEDYVCGLSHRLAGGLHQQGLQVSGGPPGPHLAHIVTAGQFTRETHESSGDPEADALYKHLSDNDVILTVRRGMLRFSPHLYNNEADIDRILDLVRDHREG